MKLIEFNIENFRSISNTSCKLSNLLTLLAGKNESGKSNILRAITSLNNDFNFDDDDIPVELDSEPHPSRITFYFNLNPKDKSLIVDFLELSFDVNSIPDQIVLTTQDNTYTVSGDAFEAIKNYLLNRRDNSLSELNQKIIEINVLLKEYNFSVTDRFSSITNEGLDGFDAELISVASTIPLIPPTEQLPTPPKPPILFKIE